jgi:X-X-X-Leu-X-X-Gly heptad repeat protein
VTRRAAYFGLAAAALLAGLAVPAFALHSGPPDVSQLPSAAKARIAFEQVSRVMGPGWATPYDVIVVARNRPLTTPALLTSIGHFETQIAANATVYSVEGPGALITTSGQLKTFGPQLKHSMVISDQSKKNLLELINGLGEAGAGSKQLQSGLASASSGATQLHAGGGRAGSGAGQLHAGLAQAHAGSAELAAGLESALAGATALRNGAAQALSGSTQLSTGLGKAAPYVKAGLPAVSQMASASTSTDTEIKQVQQDAQTARGDVSGALSALSESAAKNDPGVAQAQAALQRASDTIGSISSGLSAAGQDAATTAFLAAGVNSQIKQLAPGLTAAASGASRLQAGIKQLHAGNTQLADGLDKLAGGGTQLTSGLSQLTAGAGALQTGIGQLTNGAGELATGLAGGVGPAGRLMTGLGTMQAAVIKARGQIPSTAQLKQLEAQSPGIFNSGYFVLSAIAGATASNRNAATFTINLLRGGTAGQIVVVSRYPANDPRTAALGGALANLGRQFAAKEHAQVAVGGPGGNLEDLTSVTNSRLPLDVAIIALVLGLATRALLLPAVATVFSLLVTAASFGILQILFGDTDPVLGGPGYLGPMTIIGIFSIAFPITIVFSTLLLMRTREAYLSTGAIRYSVMVGLNQTAAAATGAGLVMLATLIPFATTDLLNVRAFGIGVAVSILLDVPLVRPVLLPAGIAVLGRLGWWPTRAAGRAAATGATGRPALPALPTTPLGASK